MRHFLRNGWAAALGLLLMSGCAARTEWGAAARVGKVWQAYETLDLEVPVTDSLCPYALQLHVRHTHAYRYANLWLFVSAYTPEGALWRRDTLDLALAAPDGRWLGQGWGDLYTVEVPVEPSPVVFPTCGTYVFKVEQAMREPALKGVHDVGIRLIQNTH